MINGVSAVCKKCGTSAPAAEFKMHLEDGIMVCPRCISNRKAHIESDFLIKQRSKAAKEASANKGPSQFKGIPIVQSNDETAPVIQKQRPPGWDAEDELLEKLTRQKEKNKITLTPINGSTLLMCTCKGCSYKFKYDPVQKKPSTCPYCNVRVVSIN